MSFILSQIFVIISIIFLSLTYLIKDKKKILILCIFSSITYGMQYLFLKAFTGMIVNAIGIVRAVWFYINNKNNKKNSCFSLMTICLLFLISTILTWDSIVSILPLFSAVAFTYSIWCNNVLVYKWIAIPVSVSWIIYNIIVGSILGYIMEGILLIIEIVGLIIFYKKNKVNKSQDLLI